MKKRYQLLIFVGVLGLLTCAAYFIIHSRNQLRDYSYKALESQDALVELYLTAYEQLMTFLSDQEQMMTDMPDRVEELADGFDAVELIATKDSASSAYIYDIEIIEIVAAELGKIYPYPVSVHYEESHTPREPDGSDVLQIELYVSTNNKLFNEVQVCATMPPSPNPRDHTYWYYMYYTFSDDTWVFNKAELLRCA